MLPIVTVHTQALNFRRALNLAFLTGAITIATVFLLDRTGISLVFDFATELGGIGNDIFLLSTNALIIGWAWRARVPGVIRQTLLMDAFVWIIVQSVKLLPFGAWALRPTGETGGFPSGHTTHAFAMAFFLTTYFPRLGWLWYSCALLISWSRVESLWHTPLQVMAGVFLGVAIGTFFINQWRRKYYAAPNARQA